MTELAAGQVTIADLYRELTGMRTDLGKALTRLEVMDTEHKSTSGQLGDHEMRLRSLEAFRWKLAGIALAVASIAGIVSGIAAAHVH